MPAEIRAADQRVSHFRQILMWPLQLMPLPADAPIDSHSQLLEAASPDNPWHELVDEFSGDPGQFHERHYSEFVTFLPYVQRFLYGEGGGQKAIARYGESPIRIFRRHDVAKVRMTFKEGDEALKHERGWLRPRPSVRFGDESIQIVMQVAQYTARAEFVQVTLRRRECASSAQRADDVVQLHERYRLVATESSRTMAFDPNGGVRDSRPQWVSG